MLPLSCEEEEFIIISTSVVMNKCDNECKMLYIVHQPQSAQFTLTLIIIRDHMEAQRGVILELSHAGPLCLLYLPLEYCLLSWVFQI